MAKEYLDKRGLTEVANHVNTRLKSVNLMPTTADEFAVRLYIGENDGIYKKGHIYQMQKTSTKKLKFSAGTTTYFADEDGTIVSTAPTSYTDVTTDVPTVNPDTNGTIIYMAGSNALVQRISDGVNPDIINSITINFARIEASTMPWWIVGSETGSYNPQAVRDVTLVALTEWVDITPFQKVMLDTPITIDGNVEYTVEEALSGLNDAILNLPVPIVPKASITFENLPNLRGVFELVEPEVGDDPHAKGWYEINAQKVFVLTIDTVVEAGKDYYEKTADSPVQLGWMYNITDEFTTTGDFVEGYGVPIGPDHNIVAVDYNGELKWDVFGGQVSTATTEKAGIVKPDGDTINLQLDGGISVSGEYKKIFEGTEEEFLDLPVAERKKYDEIHSPDGLDESQITDSITDGNMKAVTSNAVAQVVPSNASSTNKLVAKSDTVIRHDYSITGTTDAIADTQALVNHILTLGVGTYAGEFKRSGITFGSYRLTYLIDGMYSKSVSGLVTYSINVNTDATYQVSYVEDIEHSLPPEWKIEKLVTPRDVVQKFDTDITPTSGVTGLYNTVVDCVTQLVTALKAKGQGSRSGLVTYTGSWSGQYVSLVYNALCVITGTFRYNNDIHNFYAIHNGTDLKLDTNVPDEGNATVNADVVDTAQYNNFLWRRRGKYVTASIYVGSTKSINPATGSTVLATGFPVPFGAVTSMVPVSWSKYNTMFTVQINGSGELVMYSRIDIDTPQIYSGQCTITYECV